MYQIILDARLNNGLQVCVWRDIDDAVWEVEVIDEKKHQTYQQLNHLKKQEGSWNI